jgi:hypothetical protein
MRSPSYLSVFVLSPNFSVFYAVRVLYKESRWLVLPRTSCFTFYIFLFRPFFLSLFSCFCPLCLFISFFLVLLFVCSCFVPSFYLYFQVYVPFVCLFLLSCFTFCIFLFRPFFPSLFSCFCPLCLFLRCRTKFLGSATVQVALWNASMQLQYVHCSSYSSTRD